MKKIYSYLSLLLISISFCVAQPTLTSANFAYSINDNQTYYIADTNSVIDPTTGANVIFDYNMLRGYGMTQDQYIIDPTTTTYSSDFPSADFADTSNALATNTRYSELISTDSLINLGFVANVQGYGDVVARFDINPEIAMKFPFNYNDNYVDSFAGNFTVLGQNTNGKGGAEVNADAWGQLQLPGGVVIDSVLRVRTIEHVETDTIEITFPPITINPVDIDGEYINYYKPSLSKFPLLSYITGTIKQDGSVLDSNQTFISQYALPGVGVEELENNLTDINLYPNPTTNKNVTLTLELEKNTNIQVNILNRLGQTVKTVFNGDALNGTNNINIPINDLSAGLYFVTAYINGSGIAKKLVIQ